MIFMQQLFNFPTEELVQQDTTYITIVQELHATTLTNDKDRIQFENLVNQAKKNISDSNLTDKNSLLEQLDVALRNQDSLIQYIGVLVVYITPEDFYFYHLGIPVTVNDGVYISELPYILPLAVNTQYTLDYNLLVLNRDSIRLYEGHGGTIYELDLDEYEDAPIDLETALGSEVDGGSLNFGTYNASYSQSGSSQFFHGHNEVSNEKDIDRERYFRMVDDFVFENFSNKNNYPLIIFSVEENQTVFKNISKNKFLSDVTINGSASGLNAQAIEKKVAETISQLNKDKKDRLLSELNETSPENKIGNIPDDLVSTSLEGRIDTLYLQNDYEIPGTITEDGRYQENDSRNDFIKLLVKNVFDANGKVYIFEEEDMPENTPIAAKLRY